MAAVAAAPAAALPAAMMASVALDMVGGVEGRKERRGGCREGGPFLWDAEGSHGTRGADGA